MSPLRCVLAHLPMSPPHVSCYTLLRPVSLPMCRPLTCCHLAHLPMSPPHMSAHLISIRCVSFASRPLTCAAAHLTTSQLSLTLCLSDAWYGQMWGVCNRGSDQVDVTRTIQCIARLLVLLSVFTILLISCFVLAFIYLHLSYLPLFYFLSCGLYLPLYLNLPFVCSNFLSLLKSSCFVSNLLVCA